MRCIFCHGLESGPIGRKTIALIDGGLDPIAPDFRHQSLAQRVATLTPILQSTPDALLVGSSYGGITALCTAIAHVQAGGTLRALLLLAPALGRFEPPADTMKLYPPVPTTIIHGVHDEVIPLAVSEQFVAEHPSVRLVRVQDGHRLSESLETIVTIARELAGL